MTIQIKPLENDTNPKSLMNKLLGKQNKIFVIIPCHNEQGNIGRVIEEVAEFNKDFRIIVIDDGSTDHTAEAAKRTGKSTVLVLPVNLGVGGAVQTGFKFALQNNSSFAIKLDGDGQHPAQALHPMMQPILAGEVDIVIGSRFFAECKGFKSSFFRRIGIKFIQWLCFILTGMRITDPTSGLRAYNGKAIKFMAENYPTFDYPEPEEIVLAGMNGLRIKEIPVEMRERLSGKSTISSSVSLYYMLKVTLAMIFISLRPVATLKED